jgi:hypothetical protein
VIVPFTHTSLEFSELGQRSRMELDLFLEEEPTPLSCCRADKFGGKFGKRSSDWVLHLVQDFSHLVGLSCDGFEGRLLALLEDIVSNDEKEEGPSMKLGNKGTREVIRLARFINYDAHCGSASRGRSKGRVYRSLLRSIKFFLGMLEG